MFKDKSVLVTGSEGMIGKELVSLLRELGAKVHRADIKLGNDLRYFDECCNLVRNMEYVFHLVGVKGNPKMTKAKPVDFLGVMLQCDSNILMACHLMNVKKVLYTSSIAVENPDSDKYPAWAKMTGETLIEALRIQYPNETKFTIVRPSNVYGKEDITRDNLMVVSSLIRKAKEEGKLVLDINGSKQIRDLIYSRDVANGMIKAMEKMPERVNLCSGKGTSIDELAKIIAHEMKVKIEYTDLKLILGPQKKVMSNPYIKPETSLKDGIKEIIKCFH